MSGLPGRVTFGRVSRIGGAHPQPPAAPPNVRLTRQAAVRRIVAEEVEHLELVLSGRREQVGPLQDVDAASSAARTSAGEGNGRLVLVAEVDQAPSIGGLDVDRRALGRLEND
jgi:hypothetical protein